MKTQTKTAAGRLYTLAFSLLGAAVLMTNPAHAQSDAEIAQMAKSLGVVTQTGSSSYGNATIVDACHVLTNFHVAFGKSKDPVTGKIEIFENPEVGRRIDFSYGLDAASGQMTMKTKATVIEFDDYAPGVGRGMVADKALLRLDDCVAQDFLNVEVDRPAADQRVPAGNLIAIGITKEAGKFKVHTMKNCPSDPATIVTGLFLANCGMPRGTSGSLIASSERSDGKLRMVGLTTDAKKFADGSLATYAIYSKALVKFLDSALGESPIGPLASDQRKPQSDPPTTMADASKPRTVVR